MSNVKEDLGASARRGLVYISAAKLWFMVAGLLIQILLPRALGSAALFGVWTLVLAWVSSFNNVVVTGTIQAVSHFAAAGPAAAEQAKATALRMQIAVGGGATLLFLALAPVIAGFEHDQELLPHLRLAAGIVLCYSFYAVFVGVANGKRHFHKQAGLDISFSSLRAALVIGAAWFMHTTFSAVFGFVAAAAIIAGVSVVVVGPPLPESERQGPAIPVRDMLGFIGWLVVYLGATNLLMFLDGFWLKRLCTEALSGVADAKRSVDALVGVYGAAQTVARLPYQLILAGAFVIFPVMSAAALEMEKDREQTRRYIAATLRYSLVAVGAMVVALGTRPAGTMRLLYPAEYATGAPALQILLVGYLLFSMLAIVGTILNGLGRTRPTTAIGLVTVGATTLSIYLSIGAGLHAGEQPLRSAAQGMVMGMAFGLLLSLLYLWRAFRVTFAPLTLLRVGLGMAAGLGLGRLWPAPGAPGLWGSKFGTLICAALAGVLYLGVIGLLGEVSPREVLDLRRARGKSGPGGEAA